MDSKSNACPSVKKRFQLLAGAVILVTCVLQSSVALQFTQQPESITVAEGTNIILPCAADQTEDIVYQWLFNDDPVINSDRIYVDNDHNLRVSSVQQQDAGQYRCVVTDISGADTITSDSGILTVQWITGEVRVQLKVPGSVAEIHEGIRVTIICKASGNPEPEIAWFRDHFPLEAGSNIDFTTSRLKIKSVTALDNGVYLCMASNAAGSTTSSNNVTLAIIDSNTPVIEVAPEDALRLVGESVQFHCSFSGDPAPAVEWFLIKKGEIPLVIQNHTETGTFIFANGTLHMDNITSDDAASYQCICISTYGRPHASAKLTIATVQPLPSFMRLMVAENTVKSINCSYPEGEAGGIPTPALSWLKPNGKEVGQNNTKRVYRGGPDNLLIFNPVRKGDEGNYTCRASNIAGQETQILQLVVATVPRFTTKPQDVSVREGAEARLHCAASATPTPRIEWSLGGRDASGKQGMKILDNGTLAVYSATLQHNGTYACTASTVAGSKTTSATLIVLAILKFNPRPVSKFLERGELGRLVCHATAATRPYVTWHKQGYLQDWPGHISIPSQGVLQFDPAKRSDAGTYICIAVSGAERINASVKIDVFVKPKFSIVPHNATGFEGYALTIECAAYGDPEPTVTWYSDHFTDDPDRFIKHKNGTLIIKEVRASDAGKYSCIAGSDAGLNSTEVTLYVQRTPPSKQPVPTQVMTRTIGIAVGCAAAYILLVVGLMLWCRQRRRRYRRKLKNLEKSNGMVATANNKMLNEYHDDENGKMADGDIALTPTPNKNHRGSYDKLQFPRHDMQTITVIGHGAYGDVSLARAAGIKDGEEATTVMVKALQTKEESLQMDFRREIEMLCKVNHENIVNLLGVCRDAEPQLMITEYLDWGDLKQFLQATRGENGTKNVPPPLTLSQKIDIINQVALGMEHLSNNRFIHGDLAARNCLLSPSMEVKICTMSVSQDLYRAEYHEYHQKLIPVRWMPAEAIFEDELSTKSDIWAYGIFVWEVFSQGSLPYAKLDNDAVMRAMIDGELVLETPTDTPEEIEIMTQRCWADSPKDRHSFANIVHQLGRMSTEGRV